MEKQKKRMIEQKGITLIALVVTIVVLLILAGISINLVFSSDGIINKAQKASLETKINSIEERANLIYSNLLIKKYQTEIDKVTIADIVSGLREEGYKIERRQTGNDGITGISVEPKQITVIENCEEELLVNFESAENEWSYYILIEQKYYLIMLTDSGVVIQREPKELEENTNKIALKVENDYNKEIVKNIVINENKITLTGGTGEGSTRLTIKYGEHVATCEIKTAPKVTKIIAKDINIVEGENKKIEVVIEPSDAVAILSYSTIDTNKITVNREGIIEAKTVTDGKMKDTAIVTIKEERTGITETCTVTIESLVGTFIEYDVSYTDEQKSYKYTKENGWRLLKYTKNSDGTYSNIELISTGSPIRLTIYCYKEENNEWYVTDNIKLENFKRILR